MTEEEYVKNRLDMINQNSHYGLMIDTEITKLVRDHMERLEDDKMKDIYPLVVVLDRYNGTYSGGKWTAWNLSYVPSKVDADDIECADFFSKNNIVYGRGETPEEAIEDLKMILDCGISDPDESTENKEDDKMKATSTQSIKNVRNISFSIENHPAELESKLTVVATTDDDVFKFNFEGPELLQICKGSGLFTGWEKDQRIRELEKENKQNKETADTWSEAYYNLSKKFDELKKKKDHKISDLIEEYEDLQHKYNLERGANEAHHKFFRQYAGDGVEIEFNCVVGDDEVTYVIVDKEHYKALKNIQNNVRLHGMDFTPDELVNRIKELEALKTPTIENFTDEEPSSRSDILDQAKKCVCGHREQDYGTPESNFQLIADLWNQYLFKEPSAKEVFGIGPIDVSMMMALMKIARIRNGGGSGDSFVDLAGYAACGGEIWAGEEKQ